MYDEIKQAMMFLADQTHFEESPKSTNRQRQFETEEMLEPDHETIEELQEILETNISLFNAGPKGKHLVIPNSVGIPQSGIFHKEPITHIHW